jgi:hypothetical protein
MNMREARMGPTVWELEGPIPMENKSKTLIATNRSPPESPDAESRLPGSAAGTSDHVGQQDLNPRRGALYCLSTADWQISPRCPSGTAREPTPSTKL